MHPYLVLTLTTVMLGCGTTQGWEPEASGFTAGIGYGHSDSPSSNYQSDDHEGQPSLNSHSHPEENHVFHGSPQLDNSFPLWPPVVSPAAMTSIAIFSLVYYVLNHFAGNFGRYNVLAKVIQWAMVILPVAFQISNFKFSHLVLRLVSLALESFGLYTGLFYSCIHLFLFWCSNWIFKINQII